MNLQPVQQMSQPQQVPQMGGTPPQQLPNFDQASQQLPNFDQTAQQAAYQTPQLQQISYVQAPQPQPQPYGFMPMQTIMYPAMSQPQKVTVADMTVPKKGTGLKVALAITILLLIGSILFSVYTINGANQLRAEISNLETKVDEKDAKIKLALSGLGLESEDDLTGETLDRIRSQGAVSINIGYDGLMTNHVDNWLRISADRKTMLADVTIGGKGYYYYRLDGGAWQKAYAYGDEIACRDITKEAMEVISYMGIEKKVNADGVKYNCIDRAQDNKPYTFEDAIRENVYRNGANASAPLEDGSQEGDDAEGPEAEFGPSKSASMREDAFSLMETH